MELTSKVIHQHRSIPTPTYPCILKHGVSVNIIVLFSSPGVGTVVSAHNNGIYHIGDGSKKWDMKQFVPFFGTVELTSKE